MIVKRISLAAILVLAGIGSAVAQISNDLASARAREWVDKQDVDDWRASND